MAQQVQVQLIDDLDGGEATETISFALDGTAYEIDLSGPNAKALREAFAPYTDHARKAGHGATSGTPKRRRSREGRERNDDIRAWAKAKGLKVSDRGRISPLVIAKYDEAHA